MPVALSLSLATLATATLLLAQASPSSPPEEMVYHIPRQRSDALKAARTALLAASSNYQHLLAQEIADAPSKSSCGDYRSSTDSEILIWHVRDCKDERPIAPIAPCCGDVSGLGIKPEED